MKTIFKNGTYERVSNEVGDIRVNNQGWKFVSKKEWKQNVRDFKEPEVEIEQKVEVVEKKKYQKPKRS